MTTTPLPKPYVGVPGFNVGPDNPPPPITRVAKPVDAVTLRGVRVPLTSDVGSAFILDCARNRERIFSDAQIREKYDIPETDWNDIIKNKPLRLAVSRECERRMLNGDGAREAAAKEFTKAPAILGTILENERNSPKHRIDAARELRSTANRGDEKPGDTADHVIITINLGADERVTYDCGPPRQSRGSPDGENDQW